MRLGLVVPEREGLGRRILTISKTLAHLYVLLRIGSQAGTELAVLLRYPSATKKTGTQLMQITASLRHTITHSVASIIEVSYLRGSSQNRFPRGETH